MTNEINGGTGEREQGAAPARVSRTRDTILVLLSFVIEIVAVKYHATWLTWTGMALFWVAILDSTRQQPGRTRTVAMVASAVLLTLTAIFIVAMLLTSKPGPAGTPGAPPAQSSAPSPASTPAH